MAGIDYQHDRMTPRVANQDHAFGTWNRVVIAIWRVETRPASATDLGTLIGDCVSKYRDGIELLQIIELSARAPTPMARQALAKMHGEHASVIHRSALVFTKPGFAGAAVRAVMTGVAMLNPPKFEHQLFANIPEALSWLGQDLPFQNNPKAVRDLRTAVDDLRSLETFTPTNQTTRRTQR